MPRAVRPCKILANLSFAPRDSAFSIPFGPHILTVKMRVRMLGSTCGGTVDEPSTDLIQGTLDMLILKTLSLEPMHGFGIARRIEQISKGVFKVNPGSLLTAFQRLERTGLLDAEWRQTENARRAKFYPLTRAARKQLEIETADRTPPAPLPPTPLETP